MVLVLEDVEEDEEDVEGDLRLTGLESLVESFFLKNFNVIEDPFTKVLILGVFWYMI